MSLMEIRELFFVKGKIVWLKLEVTVYKDRDAINVDSMWHLVTNYSEVEFKKVIKYKLEVCWVNMITKYNLTLKLLSKKSLLKWEKLLLKSLDNSQNTKKMIKCQLSMQQ